MREHTQDAQSKQILITNCAYNNRDAATEAIAETIPQPLTKGENGKAYDIPIREITLCLQCAQVEVNEFMRTYQEGYCNKCFSKRCLLQC